MRRSLAVLSLAMVAFPLLAGCMGGDADGKISRPIRRGHAGTVTFGPDAPEASTVWALDDCQWSAAVTFFPIEPNATVGAYVLDDVRDEFPNARLSSAFTPALGMIRGYFNGVLQCSATDRPFRLVLYAIKVQAPAWDDRAPASDHFVINRMDSDNAELTSLLEERSGFEVGDVVDAGHEVVGGAERIFYDVTSERDVDAVVATRVATDAFPGPLRFWADRRVQEDTGAWGYQPVAFTISSASPSSAQRFDDGVITVRDRLGIGPAFAPNQAFAQGIVVDLDDVILTFAMPLDINLRETYYQ